jgi:hypothetical protein
MRVERVLKEEKLERTRTEEGMETEKRLKPVLLASWLPSIKEAIKTVPSIHTRDRGKTAGRLRGRSQ